MALYIYQGTENMTTELKKKFERIKTIQDDIKNEYPKSCPNCKNENIVQLIIPNSYNFKPIKDFNSKGLFSFELCDNCHQIRIDEKEFTKYTDKKVNLKNWIDYIRVIHG